MSSTAVFERLRTILHEAQIDKRVQYMIEVMFAVRKDGFKVKKDFLIIKLHLCVVFIFQECIVFFCCLHTGAIMSPF